MASDGGASVGLQSHPVIKRIPNTGFGISLGLAGNSILWKKMASTSFTKDVGTTANWIFWIGGILVLGLMSAVYAVKFAVPAWRVVALREWQHPIRAYFFVAPVVAVMMTTLGIPTSISHTNSERVLYSLCLGLQMLFTFTMYRRWMYDPTANLSSAGCPYLLSVVGWFLLSVLANSLNLTQAWGLNLAAWTFGTGAFFWTISTVSIFQNFARITRTGSGRASIQGTGTKRGACSGYMTDVCHAHRATAPHLIPNGIADRSPFPVSASGTACRGKHSTCGVRRRTIWNCS